MPKQAQSFRIEVEQIEQLEMLTDFYKTDTANMLDHTFIAKVSKAAVIELLIKEHFHQLHSTGKLDALLSADTDK